MRCESSANLMHLNKDEQNQHIHNAFWVLYAEVSVKPHSCSPTVWRGGRYQGICMTFMCQGVGLLWILETQNGNFQSPHISLLWCGGGGVASKLCPMVGDFVGFGDPISTPTHIPAVGVGTWWGFTLTPALLENTRMVCPSWTWLDVMPLCC